jgi:hypothetical protein
MPRMRFGRHVLVLESITYRDVEKPAEGVPSSGPRAGLSRRGDERQRAYASAHRQLIALKQRRDVKPPAPLPAKLAS